MLGTDNGEGNNGLDLSVHSSLLRIVLLVLVWVHPDVVECELLLDAILELLTLLESERVGLCDDRNNVDSFAQLFEDDDVNGLEAVAGWRDEVETAVDTGVLDVTAQLSVDDVTVLGCSKHTAHAEPSTPS